MKTTKHRKTIQNAKKTVSTLLIPVIYLNQYIKQCLIHKGRANYFQYLFDRFGTQIKHYEKRMYKGKKDKWKKHYQNQNMCLHRRNFRPDPVQWEQCRIIADSFGVSMCYLFVFLMELEMLGVCTQEKIKSGNTIKNLSKKTGKFFCSIRRIDFYPRSLKRKLIYRC